MIKLLIISFLLFVGGYGFGQNSIYGKYYNYFGENIILNSNKTFYFSYRFDLMGSWSMGSWSINNDTILLEITTINDTILYKDKKVVIVSHDSISEVIPSEFAPVLNSTLQHKTFPPSKLYIKNSRLYLINKKGKLRTKKVKSIEGKKKVVPYYIKVKE